MDAAAWLVVSADGARAVFIDRAQAERYAVLCHGTVHPLVLMAPGHEALIPR